MAFHGHQFLQRLRRFMFGNEINPQFLVRSADVIRKTQTEVLLKTDISSDFKKGPFMSWLAVHNHAIHVENYRLPVHSVVSAISRILRKCSCATGVTDSR